VRTALGLKAGSKLDFVADGDGFRIVALKSDPSLLRGRFAGRVARPVSIDAMNEAIAAAAAEAAGTRTRGRRSK
jgi:antitoxin PrlF